MNSRYTDKQLTEKFGKRPTQGISIDEPQELGYRCPKGHSRITWSEFEEHIWCAICAKDFHYANDCVMIACKFNPKNLPKQPKMIYHMYNMTPDGNYFHDIPKELLKKVEK